MEIDVARDWLDYAQALGVIVSLIVAGIAAIYAKRSADAADESAKAANRTADAAEETAASAREEVEHSRELRRISAEQHAILLEERRRRPALAVDLEVDSVLHIDRAVPVVLRAIFLNRGNKIANGARATVTAPRSVRFLPSEPGGRHAQRIALTPSDDALSANGTEEAAHGNAWRIDRLPPRQREAWHGLFYFPTPGIYEVGLSLEHESADTARRRFVVQIMVDGTVEVAPR